MLLTQRKTKNACRFKACWAFSAAELFQPACKRMMHVGIQLQRPDTPTELLMVLKATFRVGRGG